MAWPAFLKKVGGKQYLAMVGDTIEKSDVIVPDNLGSFPFMSRIPRLWESC